MVMDFYVLSINITALAGESSAMVLMELVILYTRF